MAAKSDKGDSSPKKNMLKKDVGLNKTPDKLKKRDKENNIDIEDDEKVTKAGKKSASVISKSKEDNEADDIEDEDDSINTDEADEDWDPDFDEFDLPKSSKKATPGKKSTKDDEDEFKVDEEFQDFFNSSSSKKYKDDDDDD